MSVVAAQAADPGARRHRVEQYAKKGVPELVAACLVDAEDRARADGKLEAIEWTAPDHGRTSVVKEKGSAAHGNAPDTKVEINGIGRDDASGGWAPLKAQCAYRKGRLTRVALDIVPAPIPKPPLDLHLNPPVNAPTGSDGSASAPPRTSPGTNSAVAAATPKRTDNSGESSRSIRPMLSQLPADTPVREPPPNFIRDHRFGVELKSQF